MSHDNATLIGIALDLLSQRAAIDNQLGLIHQTLEAQFPKDRVDEQIVTSRGIALRSVDNSFIIPPRHMAAVRGILGDATGELVTTTETHRPSEKLRAMLWNADSVLGRALRPYVEVDQTVRITFRPPDGNLSVTTEGSVVALEMASVTESEAMV